MTAWQGTRSSPGIQRSRHNFQSKVGNRPQLFVLLTANISTLSCCRLRLSMPGHGQAFNGSLLVSLKFEELVMIVEMQGGRG